MEFKQHTPSFDSKKVQKSMLEHVFRREIPISAPGPSADAASTGKALEWKKGCEF